MSNFEIGDWVYAHDWCYGQVTDLTNVEATVEFETTGGGGSYTFEITDLRKAPAPKSALFNRDSLIVTAAARAAYMDAKGSIELPNGLDGEDKLTEVVAEIVDDYIRNDYDSFDIYVENRLKYEFGKKWAPPTRSIYDDATTEWFKKNPDAQTTVMSCDRCGLYYKPILGHKCKKKEKKNENTHY